MTPRAGPLLLSASMEEVVGWRGGARGVEPVVGGALVLVALVGETLVLGEALEEAGLGAGAPAAAVGRRGVGRKGVGRSEFQELVYDFIYNVIQCNKSFIQSLLHFYMRRRIKQVTRIKKRGESLHQVYTCILPVVIARSTPSGARCPCPCPCPCPCSCSCPSFL